MFIIRLLFLCFLLFACSPSSLSSYNHWQDLTIDPGENFYQYATGKWDHYYPVSDSHPQNDHFILARERTTGHLISLLDRLLFQQKPLSTEQQQLVQLWQNLNQPHARKITSLLPLLEKINQLDSYQQLAPLFAQIRQAGAKIPWHWRTEQNPFNPKIFQIFVEQSGLGLPNPQWYIAQTPQQNARLRHYQHYIEQLLVGIHYNNATAAAKQVIHLEALLADGFEHKSSTRHTLDTHQLYSWQQIKQLFGSFNYSNFQAQFTSLQDTAVIHHPQFIAHFSEIFAQIPIVTWRAYLTFHVLHAYAQWLPPPFDQAHKQFFIHYLQGKSETTETDKQRLTVVNAVLGDVLGREYKKHQKLTENIQLVQVISQQLSITFKEHILSANWLGDASKKIALNKLKNMQIHIGFPRTWRDYSKLSIKPNDLIANIIAFSQWQYRKMVQNLTSPNIKYWSALPQSINAFYHPVRNEVIIPAALLQAPFFVKGSDTINFARIGSIIAHEMSHAFDDQGSLYNDEGQLAPWRNAQENLFFTQQSQQVAVHAKQFYLAQGIKYFSQQTLGEDLADIIGLKIAYASWKNTLLSTTSSQQQQFFITWAQLWARSQTQAIFNYRLKYHSHSPNEYRVNAAIVQINDFYSSFQIHSTHPLFLSKDKRLILF